MLPAGSELYLIPDPYNRNKDRHERMIFYVIPSYHSVGTEASVFNHPN